MTGANIRAEAVEALQVRLGHRFADPTLLERALTHASVGQTPDRVLGLCIAEALLERYPVAPEGDLSKRLNALVSGATCAGVARALGLGAALRMAGGETRNGLRDNDTVLGDACEGLIAALYLDAGLGRTTEIVRALWAEAMARVDTVGVLNPKSQLQEWAAAKKRSAPVYRVVGRTGPDHAPEFTVEVEVSGLPGVAAVGGSRQAAETAAALALLQREGIAE